jgi:hypothetical protein
VYGEIFAYVVVREFVLWLRSYCVGKNVVISGYILLCKLGLLESTYLLSWYAGVLSAAAWHYVYGMKEAA